MPAGDGAAIDGASQSHTTTSVCTHAGFTREGSDSTVLGTVMFGSVMKAWAGAGGFGGSQAFGKKPPS